MNGFIRVALATAILASVSSAIAQKTGKPAPEIGSTNRLGGDDQFTLAKYKGRLVVLFFWRTTDSASLDAIPTLNNIHKNLGKRGVMVMGFTPEEKEKVESVYNGKQMQFLVGAGGNLHRTYEVSSFPQVFLIDTAGIIVWRGHPADDLEDRIKDQMRKTPPTGAETDSLKKRFTQAAAAVEKGDLGKAYTLAKAVADVTEKESAQNQQAKALMTKIEEAAKRQLDDAREAVKAGKFDEGLKKIADFAIRMAGSDIGRQAEEESNRLKGDAKTKNLMKVAIDNARGELRIDEAADLEASKRFSDAIEAYRDVSEKYPDTAAAKAASAAIDRINTDPKIQETIKSARGDEEAERWLDLADRYVRVDMNDLARAQYDKVIKSHPKSQAATKAKKRMEKLPSP